MISYVKTATNKRYSLRRVTTIRIDVHPVGENPINMTRTRPTPVHVRPVYTFCGQSPYVVTFHESSTDLDGSHCSREKWLSIQSTARRLTDPWVCSQFLSQANQWSRRLNPSFYRYQAIRLTGPISLACDRYVQYMLVGAKSSVINRHKWRLQSWRCQLSTCHSPTFTTSCLPFPPKSPTRTPI
jgi:hypothetical protein